MRKQYTTLDNEQKIGYRAYGNGENTIIFLHGLLGSSRISGEWKTAVEKADVCLIALERAGYGDSSQLEIESVGNWIPIIQKVARELNISHCDVVGVSAGAPYAYAVACALPDVVRKVWILAGVPAAYEDSILKHYTEEDQLLYKRFKEKAIADTQDFYMDYLKQTLEHCTGNDQKTCDEYVVHIIEENLKQKCYGMALESKLQILPWNLPLRSIRQPVIMYHAKEDEMIPFMAAKEMSQHFQNCNFRELPISGRDVHLRSSLNAFLEVLGKY